MADIDTLNQADELSGLRNRLSRIAAGVGEWAGIPMPIDGTRLVVDPSYPLAAILNERETPAEPNGESGERLRNRFWSFNRRSDVLIWDTADGRIEWGIVPGANHLDHSLATMGAAYVWGVEQEGNAVRLLGTLLRHRQFKTYLLTGMFIERSPRSHVSYVFRRLRPTLALSTRGERTRILAALCLHPIAYYEGSWAGAMCPTDDVVAHLMLMRGDEAMFWRRANQHPGWRPEAGI